MRNYIEGIKSFFVNVGGVLFPKAGRDLGVAPGDRLVLDAPGRAFYWTDDGGNIDLYRNDVRRMRIDTNIQLSPVARVTPSIDDGFDLGAGGVRWQAGYFGTQVGIHSGAAFTASLTNLTLNLNGLPQALVSGVASETLELGEGTNPTIPTVPTVMSEAAIVNPVNGMIYYNGTNNKLRGFEAGAWQDLV